MLKGLEIREVNLGKIIINKDQRLDSSFYTKLPMKNENLLYKKIGDILLSSQYGVSISMTEENKGYPIYRMNEIHSMLCDLQVNKNAILSNEEFNTFKLNDKDVLFNRTNSFEWVGRTGIYYQHDNINRIFASYLVRFIPDPSIIKPEYLACFLSSKHGIRDIKRRSRESINQTNVNPEEVKAIEIPILSDSLQNFIEDSFIRANQKRIDADKYYQQAEKSLLKELGLENFKPTEEAINIKSFKTSFASTGRLDAEYYQPKYEDYEKLIKQYPNGYDRLTNIITLNDTNFTPNEYQKHQYIELSNIGNTGNITGCTIDYGVNLPSRARRLVQEYDVIISSIEGSLSSCAIITKDYNNSVCSTGFYVINSKVINSETLLVLFKSSLMQNLLKQGCSGTILTAINKDEFTKLCIPIIKNTTQYQIAELIQKSFVLKSQSEHLLEVAKQAVEIAIEQNEETALAFIEKESKIIEV